MNHSLPTPVDDITGVILSGGQGRRIHGQDKGLLVVNEKTLIEFVIAAIHPQVNTLLINANRNIDQYRQFGYPVVEDKTTGFCGPLAGVASSIEHAKTPFIVTVPCDCPQPPADLVARLCQTLQQNNATVSVAHDGHRLQPMFALLDRKVLPNLVHYLDSGGRRVDTWYEQQNMAVADFSDLPQAFSNINTVDDIDTLIALTKSRAG